MPVEQMPALISFIGIVVHVAGSLLLTLLFLILRRSADRRVYFTLWTHGWLATSIATVALLVRYHLATDLAVNVVDTAPAARALHFVHQYAAVLGAALLLGGAVMYARGLRERQYVPAIIFFGALYAAITVLLSSTLAEVILWQSPIVALSLATAAATLLRLPRSRSSTGSRVTGMVCAFVAAVWVAYFVLFGSVELSAVARLGLLPPRWVAYAPYLDLLLQVLMAFGMVVILLEDAKREVDDAHAQLEVAHNRLRRTALLDPVTGAFNRQAFEEGVGLEAAKATYGTVVMLDMDNLKTVNDSCGHAAGDQLLHHLATVLRSSLRPTDRLYRWGGDEFLLVLPGAHSSNMPPRIEYAIATAGPVVAPGGARTIQLEASLGAADYAGAEDIDVAITRADEAMYQQKLSRRTERGGRASVAL